MARYTAKRREINDKFQPDIEKLGKHIRWLRKANGMTVQELANAVGINKSNVGKIEAGWLFPRMALLMAICDVLNARVGIIFTIEEINNKKQIKDGTATDKLFGADKH